MIIQQPVTIAPRRSAFCPRSCSTTSTAGRMPNTPAPQCGRLVRGGLRQRVLKNMSDLSLETKLFNETLSMPVALAPVGLCGMYARRGEVQAAAAADAKGIPFTLSTVSVCPIEEVAPTIKRPMWFQLYVLRDRGFMRNALERAKAAGCSTLVFTVDMPRRARATATPTPA